MARRLCEIGCAFVQDIHDRGLSDDVLLLVSGEMGRTPQLNSNGGPRHYGDMAKH